MKNTTRMKKKKKTKATSAASQWEQVVRKTTADCGTGRSAMQSKPLLNDRGQTHTHTGKGTRSSAFYSRTAEERTPGKRGSSARIQSIKSLPTLLHNVVGMTWVCAPRYDIDREPSTPPTLLPSSSPFFFWQVDTLSSILLRRRLYLLWFF